jgi:hypothetical protein
MSASAPPARESPLSPKLSRLPRLRPEARENSATLFGLATLPKPKAAWPKPIPSMPKPHQVRPSLPASQPPSLSLFLFSFPTRSGAASSSASGAPTLSSAPVGRPPCSASAPSSAPLKSNSSSASTDSGMASSTSLHLRTRPSTSKPSSPSPPLTGHPRIDPRRRCGTEFRLLRPTPRIPKASRNPPRRRFHPPPRLRLRPRRPRQKKPLPKNF